MNLFTKQNRLADLREETSGCQETGVWSMKRWDS